MRGAPKIAKDKATLVRRFFRHSYIRVRNVTRATSERAQDVVWDDGVKPKDAIHVATALDAKVGILETFDQALIKRSGEIGSPPLLIRRPIGPKQAKLFP